MTATRQERDAPDLLRLVLVDPRRAVTESRLAVERSAEPHELARALRALALATHARGDAAGAAEYLHSSIAAARRGHDPVAEAEARMSLAVVLDDLGRPRRALAEVDRACAMLSGLPLGRATAQRALILHRTGRDQEALAGYSQALSVLRRGGDEIWTGRTLLNRGLLQAHSGAVERAGADLSQAREIFVRLGLATMAAKAEHNIGFLAASAGDVRAALAHYEKSRDLLVGTVDTPVIERNRAELLLDARLLPEARAAVESALAGARAARLTSVLGNAQMLAARIELAAGDPAAAATLAAAARTTFRRQGREAQALYARSVALTARVAAGASGAGPGRALERTADEMAAARLVRAWEVWIGAAHVAVAAGDLATARRCLTKAAAGRRSGPAPLRVRAWHASALVAAAEGRTGAAKRYATAGYRQAEWHQASLGATELGVRGGAAGADIATLGMRLALADGQIAEALRWLQRGRAAALRLPPARPLDDPVTTDRMAELRSVSAALATDADPVRRQRSLRRQRALEEEIRERSWRSAGDPAAVVMHPPTHAELAGRLGDRALVEVFALDGWLHALVLAGGRVHHRRLGASAVEAGDELAALRFAVRRHLTYPGPAAERAAAAVRYAAGELDRMLLTPLADLITGRPLVVIPTGTLHALPWSLLPSCTRRPVAVAPSSWLWWRAASSSEGGDGVALIAGPAPVHAAAEVLALHRETPEAVALTGTAAGAAATLRALDGAHLGHIACHGTFRADNPLFSHLSLADGPLTVCDLSALRRPPSLLVLAACDVGLSAIHPGDELQGLAAGLLGLGTRTVIASLGLVHDADTSALMIELHRRLGRGEAPAAALAAAQAAAGARDTISVANFVCLGA